MWFWSESLVFTLTVQWLILQRNQCLTKRKERERKEKKKKNIENVLQKHTGKNYYCVYVCITILRTMCEPKEGLRTFQLACWFWVALKRSEWIVLEVCQSYRQSCNKWLRIFCWRGTCFFLLDKPKAYSKKIAQRHYALFSWKSWQLFR